MAQQMEAKFVNEWLMLNYPDRLYWTREHLGPLPNVALARMYLVTNRWVDALVKDDNTVILVEAKLRPTLGAVGQLLGYRDLFPQTAKFRELHGFPVKLVLLTTREAIDVHALADQHDIEYEVYRPQWVLDYLAERYRRK